MNPRYLDIIWFQSYDPGRGLKKYKATGNHLANYQGLPLCGTRPAYSKERVKISGNLRNSYSISPKTTIQFDHRFLTMNAVPIDCRKCKSPDLKVMSDILKPLNEVLNENPD